MSIEEKKKEFFENVWDHTRDSFILDLEKCPPIGDSFVEVISQIHRAIRHQRSREEINQLLSEAIQQYGHSFTERLLQISGLTRSKLVSDMKAMGFHLSSYKSLRQLPPSHAAFEYLANALRRVIIHLVRVDRGTLEAIHQATYPYYVRQERAKRQGHEAEARLARLLSSASIPFQPETKATNPLASDAEVAGQSFDLVIPDTQNPKVVVKSTVHTANIGQFGESKDVLEIEKAKSALERTYGSNRPCLLALIDGVGFYSNSEGLSTILGLADEFCQFRTIWKAIVVCAFHLGYTVFIDINCITILDKFKDFHSRYSSCIHFESQLQNPLQAGDVQLKVAH